jgi:capsular exopolysaccharide synthesis family protein
MCYPDGNVLTGAMQNKDLAAPMEDNEDIGGAQVASTDLLAIVRAVLRRWRLVAVITLSVSIATYGVVKQLVPSRYKSTVEILVYDPQRQVDAAIQKTISPFVEAVGYDAISTEISVLKSKSVALRVASELGLDTDSEFQSNDVRVGDLAKRLGIADLVDRLGIADLAKQLGIADLVERLGFAGLSRAYENSETVNATEDKAQKLDRAADELIKRLEISQESYIISVSATSRDPVKAQRLASTVANDYLTGQREARQEALDHVASWLKGRIDNLQSHILETEASIDKLKLEGGIRDADSNKVKEEQIRALNTQLMTAHEEASERLARLEQARKLIDTNRDIASLPEQSPATMGNDLRQNNNDIDNVSELAYSAAFRDLRQKQVELTLSLTGLRNKLGEHNPQVISIRAELATIGKQMDAEVEKIRASMQNAYDVAVRRQQSLEENLQSLTASLNSEAYIKLQQLRSSVDTDRKDYESYIAQYTSISEQREMQTASARIVSPATVPRSPSSNRKKFYMFGGIAGLGGGLLLAFLLEYFKPGVKSSNEIEQSFGLPVIGCVPFAWQRKTRGVSYYQPLDAMVNEPFSHLNEAVHAMRVSLELSNANPKVILITSALPGEGKSTAAMLLAASSANSGKRTILLDCDLRVRSTSEALRRKHQKGLSELLRGTAALTDVISEDSVTKINVIAAGSKTPNAANLLMSQRMLDLIAALRGHFDYIVMDAPPLLPVVDALALGTVADKILVVVEWRRTPLASIHEAVRVLRPEVNRIAGIILNKVDFKDLPGYSGGSYHYRSIANYLSKT